MKKTITYFIVLIGISFIIPIIFSRKFILEEITEVGQVASIRKYRGRNCI